MRQRGLMCIVNRHGCAVRVEGAVPEGLAARARERVRQRVETGCALAIGKTENAA